MQYEAKSVSGVATSRASGTPWVSINQDQAKAACESIGAHLITNAEWMAIARDIESVKSNWSGTVLNRGNSDSSAAMNGTDPLSGVNKRTHTLSNGQVIWDFAGNVWEWVDDKIECGVSSCPNTLMPYDLTPTSEEWVEFTNINTWGKYSRAELGPLGAYTGTNGVGKIYTDANYAWTPSGENSPIHAFLRGGLWSGGASAGVFALDLGYSPAGTNANIGFRCAR